tara:strand:+ start:440 stop:832 length:393 start_codon:yes stop_codon:yes gene_type:complete
MGKIIFNKEEIKNILKMFESSDKDNHIIAFKALQNIDINKSIGELLFIYKYSNTHQIDWEKECSNVYKRLNNIINLEKSLTGSETLLLMRKHNASKDCIELFLEYFLKNIQEFVSDMGYTDIQIQIKIKE